MIKAAWCRYLTWLSVKTTVQLFARSIHRSGMGERVKKEKKVKLMG